MSSNSLIAGMAMAAIAMSTPIFAQETESVDGFEDWAVFNPANPKECYIVSQPKSSTATREGNTVSVNRGDIRLFVTTRPSANITREVSYTGGYPFRTNSVVTVNIGSDAHTMNVGTGNSDEWAWTPSPENDAALIASMKKGANAVVTAISARGTTTKDTFSLIGFSAALDKADELCK